MDYPRCNNVAARTMEFYRRLGLADEVRRAGLPLDHPTDVVYRVRYGGPELCRFSYPASGQVLDGRWHSDIWPTPEPNHKVNQLHFEPVLEKRLRERPGIELRRGVRVDGYRQLDDHVEVELVEETSGRRTQERARYVVGCDGGSSTVRRAMGVSLVGDDSVNHYSYSMYVRSRELAESSPDRVWMASIRNPEGRYSVIAVDGVETFLIHVGLPIDQPDKPVDQPEVLRQIVGRPVDFEILADTRWAGRGVVAERYRDRRVFLAGDAAHLWTPYAGFGMNTGVGDAVDLSWKLWAVVNGWGADALLDSYEIERRPIGERVARAIIASFKQAQQLLTIPPNIEDDTPEAAEERRHMGEVIARGTGTSSTASVSTSASTTPTHPSCGPTAPNRRSSRSAPTPRRPHRGAGSRTSGCDDGRALYDILGPGFTLLTVGTAPASAPAPTSTPSSMPQHAARSRSPS